MNRANALRLLIAVAALLFLLGSLIFVLGAFERLVVLWERAMAVSPLLAGLLSLVLLGFAAAAVWLLWWILRPPKARKPDEPVSAEAIEARVQQAQAQGLDASDAQEELAELRRRRETGELHIALYGQVSTGKSSLINALLPDARVATDVLGGTTRDLHRHSWTSRSGDVIQITDAPGLNDIDAGDALAREEAMRAHIVLYLCDGDLTRDQWHSLEQLAAFGKPMIVALNKIDRLSARDLDLIRERLGSYVKGKMHTRVVAIHTGGEEEIIREDAQGREERIRRPREAEISELLEAIEDMLLSGVARLEGMRDTAVLRLAAGKLDAALDAQRLEKAEALVATYTRRAVVGALAAVSPGSDLVIQGALATQFVRELCGLYEAVPRELEIEKLIKSANRRVRKNSAVVLAIAGNGFKAFPGAGTVTGGLMHAVAYGLLFDTLGRAMVHNLRTRGEMKIENTADVFESLLDEDLLPRAKRVAALALRRERKQP